MLSIMVPALNEEKKLRQTVLDILSAAKECGDLPVDIIIYNDGSADGTADVIARLESESPVVRSVQSPQNMGVGAGLRKVIHMAKYGRFLLIAGDNDMPRRLMLDLFRNCDKAEMVMTYFLNRENRGLFRTVLSTIFGLIYVTTFQIYVQYISGPVVYPTAKIRELKLKSRRFSIAPEMTTKLLLRGCSYCEIAGYMQTGAAGSTALSLRNLMEVMTTYLRLFVEIKITDRRFYGFKPTRVQL